jgi:hypothetical protein
MLTSYMLNWNASELLSVVVGIDSSERGCIRDGACCQEL